MRYDIESVGAGRYRVSRRGDGFIESPPSTTLEGILNYIRESEEAEEDRYQRAREAIRERVK